MTRILSTAVSAALSAPRCFSLQSALGRAAEAARYGCRQLIRAGRTGTWQLSRFPPIRTSAPSSCARTRRASAACRASSSAAAASRRASSMSWWSRTRSPTRSVGMPDWRVPKKSPGPRSSRSRSAISKPSVVSVSAFSRARALVGQRILIQQDAVRLVRPAADAAAQLVQLRQTEPLRVLDQHDGSVRHVDADFDDRGRDEHVELAARERRPSRVLWRPASSVRAAARRGTRERRPAPGGRPFPSRP